MKPPRGLSAEEQAAWAKLASSVTPLQGKHPPPQGEGDHAKHGGGANLAKTQSRAAVVPIKPATKPVIPVRKPRPPLHPRPAVGGPPPRSGEDQGLDSHWNRKLKAGQVAPDYTLDLHGHSLDAAYERIMSGIAQARAMGARMVLVIAGRERGADPADRGIKRGAIRAKLLDWLAASEHADAIAAVRRAHIRHGGEGALYLVLRR